MHKSVSGKHALRSGDLYHQGGSGSSVVRLKVDSKWGAALEFKYYADIGEPFDYFVFKIDEEIKLQQYNPIDGWKTFSLIVYQKDSTRFRSM